MVTPIAPQDLVAPAPQALETRTPIDQWLGGGLVSGGLTQVRGPQAVGKSTFLLALAEGLAAGGYRVLTVVQPNDTHLVSPRSWLVTAFSVEDVAKHLKEKPEAEIVLVDDVPGYSSETREPGASSRLWVHLLRRERDQRRGIVMTGTTRRGRVGTADRLAGQGADFVADTIVSLAPVARTRTHPGIVVEASLLKHRFGSEEELGTVLLWLRPGHKPPMTLA